jgi:hypothetical protein
MTNRGFALYNRFLRLSGDVESPGYRTVPKNKTEDWQALIRGEIPGAGKFTLTRRTPLQKNPAVF